MDYLLDAIVVIVLLAVIFGGMALAWRSRHHKQAALGVVADGSGIATTDDTPVLYLATTVADQPLNRIVTNGLGYRARGTVGVAADGIVLDLDGVAPRFIPASDLVGVGQANWTIDRGTGGARLVGIRWRLHGADTEQQVESVVQPQDPAALVALLTPLIPTQKTEEAA